MKTSTIVAACICMLLMAQPAHAIDSTQLFDTKVLGTNIEQGSAGGVPVGTVITWPTGTNPEDAENWLECNGQSTAGYPELAAVVGGNVPNYQGVFLRGYGSQMFNSGGYGGVAHSSDSLGVTQGDTIRNISGYMGATQVRGNDRWATITGPFERHWTQDTMDLKGDAQFDMMYFNAARTLPTADENRPVNKAVRYLIRALS